MLYYEKSDRFLKTLGAGVDPRLEYYNYSDPPSQATSIKVGVDPVRFYFFPPVFSWLKACPNPE